MSVGIALIKHGIDNIKTFEFKATIIHRRAI